MIILSVTLFSCKKDVVTEVIEPGIEINSTSVFLGLYGLSEPVEVEFSVSPSDAEIDVESSTEDISVRVLMEELIPVGKSRKGTIVITPGEGWVASREEKSSSLYIMVRARDRSVTETLTVRMDNNGIPYIESFPAKLFVYPYRASISETFSVSFISPYDAVFNVTVTPSELEAACNVAGDMATFTVTPKEGWNEMRFYGEDVPGRITVTISNEAGENIYSCPVAMPRLDVSKDVLSFDYHGNSAALDIVSDIPYSSQLLVPEPLVPGDPSTPLWNPNNPNPPTNDPRGWVVVEKTNTGLYLTVNPIKRRGTRDATLVVADEKKVYVREVSLKQDLGDEFDYCDNITDFEALWLIYEQEPPERRVMQESHGWGSANMRDWEGSVTLQRGERVIHFSWGGGYFPEEIRVFKKMTELQMRNMPVEMALPDWLSVCLTLDIFGSNFTGPVPEWFSDLRDYSITGCRFYGQVPDVVRESVPWQRDESYHFVQQDGYYLYYLDDNGNPVDYQGNPLEVPEWQRTDLR